MKMAILKVHIALVPRHSKPNNGYAMKLFRSVKRLVVSRKLWLILLSKI
jgi:hypothetical protein